MAVTSIASMSKKRALTPEEKRMAARIKAAIKSTPDLTQEKVAIAMGVSQGQVSHWSDGRLPVPPARAPKLASILGFADGSEISVAYRDLQIKSAQAEGAPPQPLDVEVSRLRLEVDTLRAILLATAAVMRDHRPAEGAELLRVLGKTIPLPLSKRPLLNELKTILEGDPRSLKGHTGHRKGAP